MKKRIAIIIILLILVVGALFGINRFRLYNGWKPFGRMKANDVYYACVHDMKDKKDWLANDKTLMMLVGDTHRLFGHSIHDMIAKKGISNTVHSVLFHLQFAESLTQVELVEKTHVRPSTISVALQKMEADGLITRTPSEDDQRYVKVKITEAGLAMCKEMKTYVHALDLSLTEGIDEEELKVTNKVLRQIIEKLLEENK